MAIDLDALRALADEEIKAINREMIARSEGEDPADCKRRTVALWRAKAHIGQIPLRIEAAELEEAQDIALLIVNPGDYEPHADATRVVCEPAQLKGAPRRVYDFCVRAGLHPFIRYKYTDIEFPENGHHFELRISWEELDVGDEFR